MPSARHSRAHRRAPAAALAALVLGFSRRAEAQSVAPRWHAGSASDVRWVGEHAEHVITVAGSRIERRRLDDGTLAAEATLTDCSGTFVAARGEALSIWDPAPEPGPGGLIVSCFGGPGLPGNILAAIDPETLAMRWQLAGGARAYSPISERDGRVLAEWEDPQAEAGVLAVDASTGAVLWTVTVPREQHDSIDLFSSDGVVIHTRHRGTITALDAGDGRTLWSAAGEGLRFVSMRAGVVVTGHDSSVIGRSVRDGRVVFRWNAPAMPIAFVAAGDALVLTLTSEVGGGPVGTVHAIERSSGVVRWSTPVGSARDVVVGGDHAFVSTASEVLALGLLSGAIAHRWPAIDARLVSASRDAAVGFESAGLDDGQSHLQSARAVRFEVTSGTTWRSRGRFAGSSPMLEHEGVVAACTDGGTVEALDAATGVLRWRSAIGLRAQWPGPACALRGVGGAIVALGAGDRVSLHDVAGAGRRGARVVVRGRVTGLGAGPGIRVLIGDGWTRTDADGRFERGVRSAGPITVQIDLRDQQRRCGHAEPVEITPQAARRREVVLRLGRDHCACHPCD